MQAQMGNDADKQMAQVTIEEYVRQQAGPELGGIFGAIAAATAEIARRIRLAGLGDVYGAADAVNVQGEQPVAFDHKDAEFVVIFDPLDGSSNIDVNVNVGTIFSVQRLQGELASSVLQTGKEQVAAGYVVYGPSTVMVVALLGAPGVRPFTLDDSGAFLNSGGAMQMPAQGPYYSANEANASSWPSAYRTYLDQLLEGGLGGKVYSSRYIGSLVADFHRTLLKGGVFMYPPTDKAPQGKLRLLYEANPLAMIAEQAGGAAVNGPRRILEIRPEGIHQRTPLIVGSRREVEALQAAVQEDQSS